MKYHSPPIRRFAARLQGVVLALTLSLALPLTLHSQVDLYIAGDVVLSGINDTLYAQGNVIYNAGAGKLNQVPNSALYFTGNFLNNNLTQLPFYVDLNPLLRSRGAVVADQGFPQLVGGVGKINFYSLQISKVLNTQKVDLTSQVTMHNKLNMVKGDLNVGSASIIFNSKDTASTIVGETDINRIFGTTGYLQVKQFLNSSLRSPARLGLTFNNLQDSVLVRRFFGSQVNAGDGSIERYYEVRNSNGSIQAAFGQSVYLDSTEINGHGQEANLRLFRSLDNGATWNLETSTLDSNADKVTATNIHGITTDTLRYTIADYDCANPPVDSLGADTSFCAGDSVVLNAGSGVGFTYLWNTGATTQMVTVNTTDTLWVEIMNNRGCVTRDTIIVTRNGLPFVDLALGQDTVTACANVPLPLDAANAGSTFLWSTAATTQIINLIHSDTTVSYDTVWVQVTDANGCANRDSVVFEKSPAPVVNLGGTRNICGGTNAVLNAALPGYAGNIGPSYAWNTGSSVASITVGTTGAYNVTVTNTYGCSAADTVQVNVAPSISATATATNITCNGAANGSVSLSVSGGSPAFTYLWSNSASAQNLSNLGPGTYNVTVTDALGCLANASAVVTQPSVLAHTMARTNVTCNGAADGSVSVSASGGTPAYTYLWSNGATTASQTNLGPGTYSVTVTDANGCNFADSRVITEPAILGISLVSQQNISCSSGNNGQIDISVSGGTTAYSYAWSNTATTQDVNGLGAGTYGVTVTDANGCQTNASYVITQPTTLSATETHVDVLCNAGTSGSIDLSVTGGSPAYTYQWSNAAITQDLNGIGAGSFTVTVTDLSGCTATQSVTIAEPTAIVVTATTVDAACGQSNGAAAAHVTGGTPGYSYSWPAVGSTLDSIFGIPAGIYKVLVTDANGCVDSVSAAVSNLGAPTVTLDSASNVSCNGSADGDINVSLVGGVSPFTYLWTNGATTLSISSLAAGTYDLTVTAFDGCQAFLSQLITEPTALTSAGIVTDENCFGGATGAIDFIPGGGTSPYAFLWSNGATSEDVSALLVGTYSVILTDGNGCTLNDTFALSEPTQLVLSNTAVNVSCGGGTDGSIDLAVTGGTPNYSYAWSSGQVSQDPSGLTQGTYYVTVTDQGGCTAIDSATITEPSVISLAIDSTDVLCNGGSDGTIDLTATGGTLPYAYLWSNSAITEDLSGLAPGNYNVAVTDALGCTASVATSINEPTLLTASLSATDVHCGGNANGTAIALVAGGTGAYQFSWSNGSTTGSINALAAGSYGLTVTDDNGCTVTGSVTVIEPPTLSFAATIVDVTCRDQSDGSLIVTPFGGSTPYTYAWSNGGTTSSLIGVAAGDYILALTDSAGCVFRDTMTVNQGDSALQARFLMATVVNAGDTVYFLEFSTPVPTTTYWDFGDGTRDSTSYPFHIYANDTLVDTSYYQVSLATANAWCADTVIKTIKVVNGTGKYNQGPGQNGVGDILNVAVFPNPNMGSFAVNISLKKAMDAQIQVIDLQGRVVTQRNLIGDDRYRVDFVLDNKIAAGVYLVNIQVNESQKIVRIVKF